MFEDNFNINLKINKYFNFLKTNQYIFIPSPNQRRNIVRDLFNISPPIRKCGIYIHVGL